MKKIILLVMLAALMLPTMAQGFGQQDPNQTQFQSTSTMTGSGSTYAPNPSLNSTGTANAPSYGGGTPGGPFRAPDPIDNDDWWEEHKEDLGEGLSTPLGDGLIPLSLLALAYGVVVYFRKRKQTLNG